MDECSLLDPGDSRTAQISGHEERLQLREGGIALKEAKTSQGLRPGQHRRRARDPMRV